MQKDQKDAWEHYMAYARQGGSRTFTELLAHAGLKSPLTRPASARSATPPGIGWTILT